MAVISISREPGSLGEEVAARVAGQLGFQLVDTASLAQHWHEFDLDETKLLKVDEAIPEEGQPTDPETDACARLLPDLIVQLAEEQDIVVVGRGTQGLFHDRPGVLSVRLVAPRSFRVQQVQSRERLSAQEARKRVRDLEKQRARYLRYMYHLNWSDPSLYDLSLRVDRLSMEQVIRLIVTACDEMGLQYVQRAQIVKDLLPELPEKRKSGRFVNEAEKEFAHFLEFYHIPYEYEPRTFPLETDADGKVTEAFTPDFYLPEQNLYIELTTMKQSLVTRKNRKVRKLRRLYPDVQIRIFYQRDFYNLLAKYGSLAKQKPLKIQS